MQLSEAKQIRCLGNNPWSLGSASSPAGRARGLSVPAANWATKLPEGIPRLEAHLMVIKNPIMALQKVIQQTEEVADDPARKGS
jgi:hypothetical protein